MADPFKLRSNATKAKVVEQYHALLDAYKAKVAELAERNRKRPAAEKHAEQEAERVIADTTVQNVIRAVAELKSSVTASLNQLVDKLSAEAEKLEKLRHAVSLQESRLAELHDIEASADAMAGLTAAYAEQRSEAERTFDLRLGEMEAELVTRRDALGSEIEATRNGWELERAEYASRVAHEQAEHAREAKEAKRAREREEADYLYNRDRERRQAEDAYREEIAADAKRRAEAVEQSERQLAARIEAVAERERQSAEREEEIRAMPKRLEQIQSETDKAIRAELERAHEHKLSLIAVERRYERELLEQRIADLERRVSDEVAKRDALAAELATARSQVREIAEKAIDGAASQTAFKSVKQIAMEQARRTDKSARTE